MRFVRREQLVRLSLEGPDMLEATWLLTSESFSEQAFTSRSKLRFIVEMCSKMEKLVYILDEQQLDSATLHFDDSRESYPSSRSSDFGKLIDLYCLELADICFKSAFMYG